MIRFDADNEKFAKTNFINMIRTNGDPDKMNYELLTGDWKHICFYDKDLLKEG